MKPSNRLRAQYKQARINFLNQKYRKLSVQYKKHLLVTEEMRTEDAPPSVLDYMETIRRDLWARMYRVALKLQKEN